MKIQKRLTFEKTGPIRFVGHLDMLRIFQRALSRAGIDLAFSHGFNPHPQMSFAQPLSLGVTGIREYMEIELNSVLSDEEVLSRLNAELPPGLCVHECRDLPEGVKSAMAVSEYARYEIELPELFEAEYPQWVKAFLAQDEIMIQKMAKLHGKKVETSQNIRPMIDRLRLIGPHTLELWCVCNFSQNLKPDRMMQQFWLLAGHEEQFHEEAICRTDLYLTRGGIRIPLMDSLDRIEKEPKHA